MAAEFGDSLRGDPDFFCTNFGDFQQVLKNMRVIDDRIIYALNTAIPTESFASSGDPRGARQCRQLSEQLEQSHKQREQTIRTCIDYSAKRLQELKSKSGNGDISKLLRKEQSQMRMMESELNVEEVLRNRANKILHDRCQFYLNIR